MEFTIYSAGDGQYLERVLQGVAMLAAPDNGMYLAQIGAIGLLLGLAGVALKAVVTAGREFNLHHVLLGVILFMALFGTRATVWVDELNAVPGQSTPQVRRIDNVPWGAAAAGAVITAMGYKMTVLLEQAFSTPDSLGVTRGGFGRTLELVSAARTLDRARLALAPDLFYDYRESLANYLHDCTLKGVQLGHVNEAQLFSTTDPLDGVRYATDWLTTQTHLKGADGAPELVTCNEGHQLLTSRLGDTGDGLLAATRAELAQGIGMGREGNPYPAIEQAFLQTGADAMADMQAYVVSALINSVWDQAMQHGSLGDGEVANIIMIRQAIEQRNTQWMAEESLFRRTIRPMQGFFEGLIFAVVPFMAFLVGFGPFGISMLGKYAILSIWTALFLPVLAIINLYQETQFGHFVEAMKARAAEGAASMPSADAFMALQDQALDWLGFGSMLAAATPALTLMLIFGGAVSATYLAGRLQGGDHVNERLTTPDAVSPGPVMQQGSHASWDPTQGLHATGSSGSQLQLSSANTISSAVSSALSAARSAQATFGKTLSKALEGSSGWSSSATHDLSASINQGFGESRGELGRLMASHGIDLSEALDHGVKWTDVLKANAGIQGSASAGLGNDVTVLAGKASAQVSGGIEGSKAENADFKRAFGDRLSSALSVDRSLSMAIDTALAKGVRYAMSEQSQAGATLRQSTALSAATSDAINQTETYNSVASAQSTIGTAQSMPLGAWANAVVQRHGTGEASHLAELAIDTGGGRAFNENLAQVRSERQILGESQQTAAAALMTLGGMGQGAVHLVDGVEGERAQGLAYAWSLVASDDRAIQESLRAGPSRAADLAGDAPRLGQTREAVEATGVGSAWTEADVVGHAGRVERNVISGRGGVDARVEGAHAQPHEEMAQVKSWAGAVDSEVDAQAIGWRRELAGEIERAETGELVETIDHSLGSAGTHLGAQWNNAVEDPIRWAAGGGADALDAYSAQQLSDNRQIANDVARGNPLVAEYMALARTIEQGHGTERMATEAAALRERIADPQALREAQAWASDGATNPVRRAILSSGPVP